ncbi:MAG: peptide-methionine (S)-S-oxide reductase [Micavibrio aeruginosavorus]|uniref:Peptide methionine sulfoxide reductase MsrA n=1 Tax=Micavibrio aeruginosavorus TaxID=349221 RepID=A0A2W5PRU2_9BACT|nr:MAG: peptide-methionine (S)-S-oxide reductase [Micavibrio aeruginosavorus]
MKMIVSLIAASLFLPTVARAENKTAIFAGGCFWCMEAEFSHHKGISDVTSGYAGGPAGKAPTYEDVSSGMSGFNEAISVTYDPAIVTYAQLLDIFWSNVDPFDDKGQFCDKGSQYVAAIFYGTPDEEKQALTSLKKIEEKFKEKVATQIEPRTTFFPAEEHHQDYSEKNSVRYNLYKNGCGRPKALEKIWGGRSSD